MLSRLATLLRDRRGATALEYGLILAVIVIVMLVALQTVATATIDIWTNVATKVVKS